MQRLKGKVAVVTGASRGGGRGIALVLGEEGATVYVTGRSVRGKPTADYASEVTIDDTAEAVTARGGVGIPVRCDHTVDADIEALFARVKREQGRLDLLVNNAWGGYENYDDTFAAPFWEQPIARWDKMWTAGIRSHLVTTRLVLPLMLPQHQGLIINTTTYMKPGDLVVDRFYAGMFYGTAKTAINRMAQSMAHDLRPHNIAVIALSPGFMRTEAVLKAFNADEQTWRSIDGLKGTESPQYVGRAVAALTAEPDVMRQSGKLLVSGDVAQEYGFTDVNGDYVPSFYAEQT